MEWITDNDGVHVALDSEDQEQGCVVFGLGNLYTCYIVTDQWPVDTIFGLEEAMAIVEQAIAEGYTPRMAV